MGSFLCFPNPKVALTLLGCCISSQIYRVIVHHVYWKYTLVSNILTCLLLILLLDMTMPTLFHLERKQKSINKTCNKILFLSPCMSSNNWLTHLIFQWSCLANRNYCKWLFSWVLYARFTEGIIILGLGVDWSNSHHGTFYYTNLYFLIWALIVSISTLFWNLAVINFLCTFTNEHMI